MRKIIAFVITMGNEQIKAQPISDKEIEEKSKRECDDINTELKDCSIQQEEMQNYEEIDFEKQLQLNTQNICLQPQKIEEKAKQVELMADELPKLSFANPEVKEPGQSSIPQQKIQKVQPTPHQAKTTAEKNKSEIDGNNFSQVLQPLDIILEPQNPKEQISVAQVKEVTSFSSFLKSSTINLDLNLRIATQMGSYWENKKLILTEPIMSRSAKATFRVSNLKYCVGCGIALKQVIQKHQFNYKSYENELSHGLFLVTSQGYSWSHTYKSEDDILRQGFNKLNNNDLVTVELKDGTIIFTLKQFQFELQIPASVLQKYTLCFCAYLHEKEDRMSLELQNILN